MTVKELKEILNKYDDNTLIGVWIGAYPVKAERVFLKNYFYEKDYSVNNVSDISYNRDILTIS